MARHRGATRKGRQRRLTSIGGPLRVDKPRCGSSSPSYSQQAQEPSSWESVGEIDCLAEGARCFGCHTLNYCNGHGKCEQKAAPGAHVREL